MRITRTCGVPEASPRLIRQCHGLLNHLLLGDQIWMARFEGNGQKTPPLNTVLLDEFADLRRARMDEGARIEAFFANLSDGFLNRQFRYINNQGRDYVEEAPVAISHFFNHHRGQVHIMFSQTPVAPPSLDLHRIINP